ncbi:flagellar hook-basal body complex protein [Alicyclobacillus mali]|uniref:Flagellar hook protein FlgE n=1 Tax=Alicyclobacillus mali (ex Roth et al. 2021) TaxID=1123961 RepID=A0ABS0F1W0_9BACL|nr:flagellar hook-basal body complex protein [Alicyclobacillus mali (ex Roth et al. 2021)]MBF8377236.1 flagellar hook-basal body complex protein [Alicyclobacillus mali (ex Roth et al. 2021)]MCL6488114.1 flagellar hook-basal body complex protein [Alicyclobacillus mali (ex Roth et al. 2021)]
MLRSMNSAISGMQAFQTDLDVVGNNIANVETVGFKQSDVQFADLLSQTMSLGTAGTASGSSTGGSSATTGMGGTNPEQVGLGVQVGATQMDMSQGPDETTGVPTNVAIQGNGFFVVTNGTNTYLTRAGNFSVDSAGNLVLPNGVIAEGYSSSSMPSSASTTQPTTEINVYQLAGVTQGSGNTVSNVSIGSDGSITATITNGTTTTTKVIGYLALAQVPNPQGLVSVGDNLFSASSPAAGQPTYWTPGQGTYGTLASGELEGSNVDLSQQFAEMIVAQNAYVANTHMIGTDNAILQALVNMKNS